MGVALRTFGGVLISGSDMGGRKGLTDLWRIDGFVCLVWFGVWCMGGVYSITIILFFVCSCD